MCTPPDQSIPVKTPRTSTPSLKTIVANHVDKRLDHNNTLTTASKIFDQRKGKALPLSTKKANQQNQNGKKMDHQNSKRLCDQTNTRDDVDDHKYVTNKKKSALPLKVTENNIDSFLNQLSTKPKPVTKKYSTRSTVKQSQISDGKKQYKAQENVTLKKQSNDVINKTVVKQQQSYQPASPVVKLQQNKWKRAAELPKISTTGLSAFDFNDDDDDDDSQPLNKKPRRANSSSSSSCNSSLEMSRLNASLLARGNTSKSFSMTPQKKGRNSKNKKHSPNKRPVSR